jgi:hypothetical protein
VDSPVGKSLTQIKLDGKRLVASDSETYDKWTQAIASAGRLAEVAAKWRVPDATVYTFVMPVLLVADKTLWVVNYSEAGERGAAVQVDETLSFVDRSHEIPHRYGPRTYPMRHLFIYTQSGFAQMLKNYNSKTGIMAERTFGFLFK